MPWKFGNIEKLFVDKKIPRSWTTDTFFRQVRYCWSMSLYHHLVRILLPKHFHNKTCISQIERLSLLPGLVFDPLRKSKNTKWYFRRFPFRNNVVYIKGTRNRKVWNILLKTIGCPPLNISHLTENGRKLVPLCAVV